MRKIGKLLFIGFIFLQSFVWLKAVCGDNTNPADSMACCKHARLDTNGVPVSSLSSCCGHCNMGETSLNSNAAKTVLPRPVRSVVPAPEAALLISSSVPDLAGKTQPEFFWYPQKFLSASHPKVFLLHQTFLI